jgi:phosphate transport system substrate-binding protein
MTSSRIIGISVSIALLAVAVTRPAEAADACFCAKRYDVRFCGETTGIGLDVAILKLPEIPPIELNMNHWYDCTRAPQQKKLLVVAPAAADRPPVPPTAGADEPVPPPSKEEAHEHFGIAGSNTIGEQLMPELITAFGQENGFDVNGKSCSGDNAFRLRKGALILSISCSSKGSGTGIEALEKGLADIAMLSRPISDGEQARMRKLGYPDMRVTRRETVLALDGLLIIVSQQNRVSKLSVDQIAKIFAGEITDWAQLGGTGKIKLYVRNKESGTRDTFEETVMEPRGKTISATATEIESSSTLSDRVAQDPRAIGFVGYAYWRDARPLRIVEGGCGLVHTPSDFVIKTEDYPLSRRLLLYTAKAHSAYSQDLIDFALSDRAQRVIDDAKYVTQAISSWTVLATKARISDHLAAPPKEKELETDSGLLKQLQETAAHAERLSISFRFRPGSAVLDTKALQDVRRLARHMKDAVPNRKLLLLGFADAKLSFAHNLRLSQERADAVRAALLNSGEGLAPDRIVTKAYSELLPVACNDDEAGREKNRRVEAWLAAP